MACYAGTTVDIEIELPAWHEIESFWDSVTGKSPLMQLCRACRTLYAEVSAPALNFSHVGTNPGDTQWGSTNYEANPTWNAPGDHQTILTQINDRLMQISQPGMVYVNQSTCIQWGFTNNAALAAARKTYSDTLVSPVFPNPRLLYFERQEDWKAIMLAQRTFMDSLSGLKKTSAAWPRHLIRG